MHDDASMRAVAVKLMAAPARDLEELQKIHGFKRNAHGILLNAALDYKGASTLFFDWMHSWAIGGAFWYIFAATMECTKSAARALREDFAPTPANLDAYMRRFKWPRQFADGNTVFESGGLNGSASQIISAAPVIARYFREVVAPVAIAKGAPPKCQQAIDVLLLACRISGLLAAASRGRRASHELRALVFECFRKYLEVHGKDDADWTLKFHLMLHAVMAWVLFAEELYDEFVQMPNCFALERKHKPAKKNMKDKLSGRSQERSVLESMV